MAERVTIDVVSDVVCPWCYIGQKRLEQAVAELPDLALEVRWRPFQLDPTIPKGGTERRAYMLGKFGSEARVAEIHGRIEPLGAAEGIAFDFAAIERSPNTLDAHRLIRWAGAASTEIQNRLVRGLFARYFEHGEDIGDHAVLIEAAMEAGMDAGVAQALLPTDADRAEVQSEIATASRMGITGVPCFLIDRRYAVMGAQDSATLARAIRQAWTPA